MAKIQLNNHKDSTGVKIDGSESSVHKPSGQAALISNGEPKKKTLREMLAGIPGFSMKVSKFICHNCLFFLFYGLYNYFGNFHG